MSSLTPQTFFSTICNQLVRALQVVHAAENQAPLPLASRSLWHASTATHSASLASSRSRNLYVPRTGRPEATGGWPDRGTARAIAEPAPLPLPLYEELVPGHAHGRGRALAFRRADRFRRRHSAFASRPSDL